MILAERNESSLDVARAPPDQNGGVLVNKSTALAGGVVRFYGSRSSRLIGLPVELLLGVRE